jgi:hypothetical protein
MWFFKRKEIKSIEDFPKDAIGFIYKITNLETGKMYIGKKVLFFSRKTKISKREKSETGTRKKIKKVIKESNWKDYYGSSQELSDDIMKLGTGSFKREILEVCCNLKYLSYAELKHQIKCEVLENNSYNGNILGKFFKKDTQNCYANN